MSPYIEGNDGPTSAYVPKSKPFGSLGWPYDLLLAHGSLTKSSKQRLEKAQCTGNYTPTAPWNSVAQRTSKS